MHIRIPANNWHPRPHQMPLWGYLERGGTRAIEVAHRRWGKDEICLHWGCVSALLRPGNYHHALPEYAQARKAIWTAVNPHTGRRRIDEAFPHEIRSNTNEQEMFIRFKNESTWQVIGSDNYDRLVGSSIAGITFSEWALANPAAWAYISPIVAENKGWAVFITTPRGRNHAKTMYDMAKGDARWHAEISTIAETGIIPAEVVEQMRLEYVTMFGQEAGESLVQQELYCSFEAAILGSYFGKEMVQAENEGRITAVPCWPGCPVHTAWDLGSSRGGDTMTIWFWQVVPSSRGQGLVRVISCLSGSAMSIQHYANEIRLRRLAWATETKTDYQTIKGTDYVPHDARVPEMTSSGHDGRAKQRIEVMIECGLKPKIVTEHHVSDGVSAVRQLLPKAHFDAVACATGIEALRQYQREWDDEKKVFKDTPLKNWAAHWADAARYMAMAFKEVVLVAEPPKGKLISVGPQNQVTLDDLWALNKRGRKRI